MSRRFCQVLRGCAPGVVHASSLRARQSAGCDTDSSDAWALEDQRPQRSVPHHGAGRGPRAGSCALDRKAAGARWRKPRGLSASGTLTCPGMQIFGWFCSALPVLPPASLIQGWQPRHRPRRAPVQPQPNRPPRVDPRTLRHLETRRCQLEGHVRPRPQPDQSRVAPPLQAHQQKRMMAADK